MHFTLPIEAVSARNCSVAARVSDFCLRKYTKMTPEWLLTKDKLYLKPSLATGLIGPGRSECTNGADAFLSGTVLLFCVVLPYIPPRHHL